MQQSQNLNLLKSNSKSYLRNKVECLVVTEWSLEFLSFAVFRTNLAGGASSLLLTGDGSRRRFPLDFIAFPHHWPLFRGSMYLQHLGFLLRLSVTV